MTVTLGMDVSRYQDPARLDYAARYAGGARFCFVKASQAVPDPAAREHLERAAAAGLLCGLYHFVEPQVPARQQIDLFLSTAARLPHWRMVALDVETTGGLPPAALSEALRALADGLKAALGTPALNRLVIYTRRGFLDAYCPQAWSWLPWFDLWLAQYPYAGPVLNLSWEELHARWWPNAELGPSRRAGFGWKFWQFQGGRFVLPGYPGGVDLDLFNGSEEELRAYAWTGPERLAAPQEPAGGGAQPSVEQRLEDHERRLAALEALH